MKRFGIQFLILFLKRLRRSIFHKVSGSRSETKFLHQDSKRNLYYIDIFLAVSSKKSVYFWRLHPTDLSTKICWKFKGRRFVHLALYISVTRTYKFLICVVTVLPLVNNSSKVKIWLLCTKCNALSCKWFMRLLLLLLLLLKLRFFSISKYNHIKERC